MDTLRALFEGSTALWSGGVAHSVLILSLVIAFGIMLGKVKIFGVSLGITWILFVGIVFGHFNIIMNEHLLHFLKEFGLILFVYSIGMQVGPGFFSAFKKGGIKLNMLAVISVMSGVAVTVIIYYAANMPITTMVGILSGAVTNTPGLGAAQQAVSDITGSDIPEIAMGYAVAYPLGVIGIIVTMLAMRYILRLNVEKEERDALGELGAGDAVRHIAVEITNPSIEGKSLRELHPLINRDFVVSRIKPREKTQVELVTSATVLRLGDIIRIVAHPADLEAITVMLGKEVHLEWKEEKAQLISRRILITKPELNGKTLAQLKIRNSSGANITRINRSGVDLVATPKLQLQMGDRVTIVGSETAIAFAETILGNSMKRLNHPNLIPIFIGIALGCVLGSIPFAFPGIPQPIKLGLAGGPLIVAILISRYGPRYKMVTYTTMSANLMLREIGISLFLACVGLGAGNGFVDTVINGGYVWIGYGALITLVPLVIAGIVGRFIFKLNYYTMIGVMAGSYTSPPALAFAGDQSASDAPAVGYATVYPLTMFLRVLTAQLLILLFL